VQPSSRIACVLALGAFGLTGCASSQPATTTESFGFSLVQRSTLRGAQLWVDLGCAACHSTNGTRGVGPTIRGLAGSRVRLRTGRTREATSRFLREAILGRPGTQVRGYPRNAMRESIGRARRLDRTDVQGIVDFIESVR